MVKMCKYQIEFQRKLIAVKQREYDIKDFSVSAWKLDKALQLLFFSEVAGNPDYLKVLT